MIRVLLLLTVLLMPAAAAAQFPGIAFVQAPEAGAGVGTGDHDTAMAAAMAQCRETAEAEDCFAVTFCQPAGWSIDLFLQHVEGPHWHQYLCGLPDRPTAERIAAAFCAQPEGGYLIECQLVQLFDPDGRPQMK